MSTKRFLFVLVACALVSVAALAGWRALPYRRAVADRAAIHQVRSASHLEELERIKDTLGIPDRPISASRLEQLERYKGTLAVTTNPISASRRDELARIKDDWIPRASHFAGPSQLEELAQIKEQGAAADTAPAGPSRLEVLEGIKGMLAP